MVWYPVPAFSARARNSASVALSMKMEMRVFPFWGITAPRLPFEKSYSAFIGFALSASCVTGRDEARLAIAVGVDHDQEFTGASKANGHVAWFIHGTDVLDRQRKRIEQRALGIGEGNAMLLEVGRSLDWVVLERHFASIYILYAYGNALLCVDLTPELSGRTTPPLRTGPRTDCKRAHGAAMMLHGTLQ